MSYTIPQQTPAGAATYDERIAIVLGLVTLVAALATFASCRSCVAALNRVGLGRLTDGAAYRWFFRYHAVYWFAFGVALASHITMSVGHTGLPQPGDPDAGAHWLVLGAGLASVISGLSLFSSCRILPGLVFRGGRGIKFARYQAFFRFHAYLWLIFLAVVAGHFMAGYAHAGLWPSSG